MELGADHGLVLDHVEIVHEPVEVTTILDAPSDAQTLWLSDGRSVDVDAVVLCVGHIPAALSDERGQWQRFARDAGLCTSSGLPRETPVDALPPGQPVLIRGFGLNFFDLQSLLTHGRGGTFRSDPERGPLYHVHAQRRRTDPDRARVAASPTAPSRSARTTRCR